MHVSARAPRWEVERSRRFALADPDVGDHVAWCRAAGFTDRTITCRIDVLARFLRERGMPLGEVTDRHVSEWLGRPGWSAQTRATYRRHLSGFYGWRVDNGRADHDPTAGIPAPKVPLGPPLDPVPDEVAQMLLAEAAEPWRACVTLAYYAGLRSMEIADLLREDVTEARIVVHGKGGKTAHVPTHPKVWALVRDMPAGPVVRWPDTGEQMTASLVSKRFVNYVRRSYGLVDVSMHRFRHGFARRLRRAGTDPRVIQTLLRHSSLNTTMRYLAVDEDERSAAIAAI